MSNIVTLDQTTRRVRELNDALRVHMIGGEWLLTPGVIAARLTSRAMRAVQAFDSFDIGNDPHGEHDFGSVVVDGHTLFWKIDYYDLDADQGSPDPADPDVTRRVLTLMLAEEY